MSGKYYLIEYRGKSSEGKDDDYAIAIIRTDPPVGLEKCHGDFDSFDDAKEAMVDKWTRVSGGTYTHDIFSIGTPRKRKRSHLKIAA